MYIPHKAVSLAPGQIHLTTTTAASGSERHRFFAVAYVAGISHGEAWNPRDSRSHEHLRSFSLI